MLYRAKLGKIPIFTDMKYKLLICALAALCTAACAPKTSVVWTEGTPDPQTGKAVHSIVIQNPPKGEWTVWCSAFRIRPTIEEGSTGTLQHVAGSLHKIVPTGEFTDSVVIRYKTGPLARQSWAPEVFTLDIKGKKPVQLPTTYNFIPVEPVADFAYNDVPVGITDMVPALKSVAIVDGVASNKLEKLSYKEIQDKYLTDAAVAGKCAGWYRITVGNGVKIEAADPDGAFWAAVTLSNIERNARGEAVPDMVIEDWPDMAYRGMMLDVARNFTSKDNVLKLIDVLAHFKVNVLHLHLGDDEGWRIEVPGIPELTEYSAFHEVPVLNEDGSISEPKHLMPTYSGAFDPKDLGNSGNGYFSKADFIEILKYAQANHIRVIPEIDSPGHARAAIKAMDAYCDRTGDESYRLTEPEDSSEYYSVQYYDDNALNVALPGTYKFMEKVIDTFIAYYEEAGVEFPTMHIGGDEVAGGAWKKSPACLKLMAENGWTTTRELKNYYLNRIMDIAEAKGIKIAGWQEVAMHLDDATLERIRKNLEFNNCWSSYASNGSDQLPYKFANQGIGVVLSTMTNAYADFAYNPGKLERGHSWGGYVDERRSYCFLPYDVYKSVRWDDYGKIKDISKVSDGKEVLAPQNKPNNHRVQAQLWTETIRCFDHVTYYIFPKMVGLFERGWNATPEWGATTVADDPLFTGAFDKFYSTVVKHEMPYFDEVGICYRKRQ